MTVAVTIGAYKLSPFVELGILRWRRIIPAVPILVSDDLSEQSAEIRSVAERHECDYVCSDRRRGHFAADMQTFINGLVFCREIGADVVIKCSQRVIPVVPALLDPMFSAFSDPVCQICLPGQMSRNQIARPGSRFLAKFGVLSDLVAIRCEALPPEELLAIYRERAGAESVGKRPISDSFAETTLGYLIDKKFPGQKSKILNEWSNHRPGHVKLYLRKSQSHPSEYNQVAQMEALSGDASTYDLREWLLIEQKNYRPKADVV